MKGTSKSNVGKALLDLLDFAYELQIGSLFNSV